MDLNELANLRDQIEDFQRMAEVAVKKFQAILNAGGELPKNPVSEKAAESVMESLRNLHRVALFGALETLDKEISTLMSNARDDNSKETEENVPSLPGIPELQPDDVGIPEQPKGV